MVVRFGIKLDLKNCKVTGGITIMSKRFSGFRVQTICSILLALFFLTALSIDVRAEADKETVEKAQQILKDKGCIACHTIGGGKLTGPDLLGVTDRREEEWLKQWLKSPDTMVFSDPIAKEMLKEYLVPMPNQGLTDEEVDILVEYFEYEDANNAKK